MKNSFKYKNVNANEMTRREMHLMFVIYRLACEYREMCYNQTRVIFNAYNFYGDIITSFFIVKVSTKCKVFARSASLSRYTRRILLSISALWRHVGERRFRRGREDFSLGTKSPALCGI